MKNPTLECAMDLSIQRVVDTIQERYCEPLSLDQLARTAIMSKFHFLRTFRDVTGVTPGRFLSAVRLEAAKHLLHTTSLNVSDIAAQVGYSSTGSFTRRFTESVGCSPTQYRHAEATGSAGESAAIPAAVEAGPGGGTITGMARARSAGVSAIYIGVFASPILERSPAAHAVITEPGPFRMTGVPRGTWYIHAVAYRPREEMEPCGQGLLVDTVGPVQVGPGGELDVDLTVRPPGWAHPPVLLALPDLDRGRVPMAA